MGDIKDLTTILRDKKCDEKNVLSVARTSIDLYFIDTKSKEITPFWKTAHKRAQKLDMDLKEFYHTVLSYLDKKMIELDKKPEHVNNLLTAMGHSLPKEDQRNLKSYFNVERIYRSDGNMGAGKMTSLGKVGNRIISLGETKGYSNKPTCGDLLREQGLWPAKDQE